MPTVLADSPSRLCLRKTMKLPENKMPKRVHLLDISFKELEEELSNFHSEQYRARQICEWIFIRRVTSFDLMANLPALLRRSLSERFVLRRLQITHQEKSRLDRTTKFTFKIDDHLSFPSVFLPHRRYNSLCISTQVGCAWKCRFCASGLTPFERNLSCGEILDQVFLVETETGQKVHNVLFMGMGEPLSNYEGTVKAIRWFISPTGFHMNPSRITLSTTGLIPQIKKLTEEQLKVNLALSLHASDEETRKKIMPVSGRFPIRDILNACKIYQSKNDSDFTIEYMLLKNVNDKLEDAEQLTKLIRAMGFRYQPKINLIPYNPVPSISFQASDPLQIESFFDFLKRERFIVHTRRPQGKDISAACGQLL